MQHDRSIQIETGARLHLGLLNTSAPFGGIGVMVDQPSTVLEFAAANEFSTDKELRCRALPIAQRLCHSTCRDTLPAVAIRILRAAPAHSGFGSGTQLSLAIADGLARWVHANVPDEALATQIADRGKRSAVGVHGYFHGGLIFESGDNDAQTLNAIQNRLDLPKQWRVLLVRPATDSPSVFGTEEAAQFERLSSTDDASEIALRSIIEGEILPAARSENFNQFAAAVEAYNHASGMLFAAAQGGPYNGPFVTSMINTFKQQDVIGVGQSSWGPGVFAWCEDQTRAQQLASTLDRDAVTVTIAKVQSQGRQVHER